MTLKNLRLALQLNNNYTNDEINIIIDFINSFYTNQKILHYEINKHLTSVDNLIDENHSDSLLKIANLRTTMINADQNLSDSLDTHRNNTVIHVTQADKDLWNSVSNYSNQTTKDHIENLVIHVTQEDKDLWNATLQNAKNFAQELFNRLTSFEIIKCQTLPTEDIKTMTIYFLQIDPEQDDLYEEYMYIDGAWEKIGNTRIDLSDYVTKSMLQSEVDTLNNTINSKESTINQTISDLEDKHDTDVSILQSNINDLSQDLSDEVDTLNDTVNTKENTLYQAISDLEDQHDQDISDLLNKHNQDISDTEQIISDLENKHDTDISNINNNINQLEQDISDLNTGLDNVHTHDNKSVLDNLTQNVIDNSHIHNNKSIIDKFSNDSKGNLLYNNENVICHFTEQDVTALINYLWNIESSNFFTSDNKYILTKDNCIFTAKEGDS